MSVKVKACSACQRNGRLTCRRYVMDDELWTVWMWGVFFFSACGVKVSDVTAVSGPGWGSRVWRRTLWSAWMCWRGPESPSGPDAPWRRASDWLSWRLWCRCWRSTSVTLWMLSGGIFTRWGEQRHSLTYPTTVCICGFHFYKYLTGCLYFYSSATFGYFLQHCLWIDTMVQLIIFIIFICSFFIFCFFEPATLWDSRVRTDSGQERGAPCRQQPEEVDAAAACGKKPGGTFRVFVKPHKHLDDIIRNNMRT